jgi:hypothetical protein
MVPPCVAESVAESGTDDDCQPHNTKGYTNDKETDRRT